MSTMRWAAGITAVSVAAVGAGVPVVSGAKVESGFDAAVERMSVQGLEVDVADYQRGWMQSHAETRWTIPTGDGAVEVGFDHVIHHGPPISGRLARVESVPVLPAEVAEALRPYFGDRAPLRIDSVIGVTGAQTHRIASPDYSGPLETATVDWSGLSGTVEVSADNRRVRGELEAPHLGVEDDQSGSLALEGLRLEFDNHREAGETVWLGEARMGLERLAFSGTDLAGTPRELELAGARIESAVTGSGDQLTLGMVVEADALDSAGQQVRDAGLALSLENIDRAAYNDLQERMQAIVAAGHAPEEQGRLMGQALQARLPALLAGSPELRLERLGLATGEGELDIHGHLRYAGDGGRALGPLQALEGRVEMQAGAAVLRQLLAGGLRSRMLAAGMEDGEALAEQARLQARQQLEGVERMGFLRREGDAYHVLAELDGGSLTVNGQPISPMMLGGAPGAGSRP